MWILASVHIVIFQWLFPQLTAPISVFHSLDDEGRELQWRSLCFQAKPDHEFLISLQFIGS